MLFQQLFDPVSSTYTYVLAGKVGGEAMIIDPVYEHVDNYIGLLERLELRLVKAIDTHIHADHITGLGALRDITRCVTVMGDNSTADVVAIRAREGESIAVDGVSVNVLYTPGHTDDSYSFVMPDRVFSGDALLIRGTGRTDFQNGDARQSYDSLFNKLLKLPDHTLLYPGHDYNGNTVSTIVDERRHNPRLQVRSEAEYVEIMNNLDLADPKMMDKAVPANRAIGLNQRRLIDAGQAISAESILDKPLPQGIAFIDLREHVERGRDGHIPGDRHIPYDRLAGELRPDTELAALLADHPERVVFYCAFGERSALAVDAAVEYGAGNVRHMMGGLGAWIRAGGKVSY